MGLQEHTDLRFVRIHIVQPLSRFRNCKLISLNAAFVKSARTATSQCICQKTIMAVEIIEQVVWQGVSAKANI